MREDVIHFEALGEEAIHIKEETEAKQKLGLLPQDFRYIVTPENLQTYIKKHKDIKLPNIITTKTHSKLPQEYLEGAKKSIITRSAGYDHFENLQEVINLTSLREYCVNAVAQTAIKFVYAMAGRLNEYTKNTETFERNQTNSFMELGPNRTATVFGVGKIGKRVYELLEGNGLNVQAVDIREEELKKLYKGTVKFVNKEEAIQTSDIIVNVMNLTKDPQSKFYNVNYFSEKYLCRAKKGVMFANVTRGDIAPESVLLKLYNKKIIGGIGLDVFTDEAKFSKLIKDGLLSENGNHKASKEIVEKALDHTENFYVQPHQGFNSDLAAIAKAREAVNHICEWYKNDKENFNEQLPYYEG
ncbi:NAD(P)-dependent oxidoreductase [Fusobacterium sp. IOR10]|uniref:NAD(P)-dependent oxidoreductase n=1 Tax=Fusobacterium sp. IOR10 TaxID=2665157 RepID=UPI0013D1CDC5|nr:NAD(P)-dependent oxidoreductase [Fusobacterium sp. IOR10]